MQGYFVRPAWGVRSHHNDATTLGRPKRSRRGKRLRGVANRNMPKRHMFGLLNDATPAGFPLMTALLKSRVDIGAENMSPGANGRPWIYHGARLSIFDFDWPYDVPFAVRQFLE